MDSQNSIISSNLKYDFSLFFNNLSKLLRELYIILLNIEITTNEIDKLNEFINNFLSEYDLDPKNVLEIIKDDSQNYICYSSLIGYFYQYGIGCEIDEIK